MGFVPFLLAWKVNDDPCKWFAIVEGVGGRKLKSVFAKPNPAMFNRFSRIHLGS
jgi:hypothetical protein